MRTSPRANASALAPVKQAADEDHRAEDVDEQREVPAVRPDRCEDARHAPGFQIMSMRISSTDALDGVCKTRPRCVRLIASSSALGPVWPAASSSLAFFIPAMYSGTGAAAGAGGDRPEDDAPR